MKKIFLLLILVCFSASSQFIKLQNTKYFVVYDTLIISPRYAKYVIDFNTYSVGYARKSITLDTRLKRKSQANAFDFAKNNVYDRGHLAPVIDFEYNGHSFVGVEDNYDIGKTDLRIWLKYDDWYIKV